MSREEAFVKAKKGGEKYGGKSRLGMVNQDFSKGGTRQIILRGPH